ncbi:hypothetical protein P8452_47990 [Trifolium repens]|nr:hypothetical protein P8452_47990 [Trifolium repens]
MSTNVIFPYNPGPLNSPPLLKVAETFGVCCGEFGLKDAIYNHVFIVILTKSALDQVDWIEKITDVAMVQANQAKHFNNQYGKRQMMQIGFLPRTKSWTKV